MISLDCLISCTPNQLSEQLLDLCAYLLDSLPRQLALHRIPSSLLLLPAHLSTYHSDSNTGPTSDPRALATPIIPVLTPHPRPLSAYLRMRGLNARPITWPTVPKGADRIRVCLHSRNTREDVDRLVNGMIEWAQCWEMAQKSSGTADSDTRMVAVRAKL